MLGMLWTGKCRRCGASVTDATSYGPETDPICGDCARYEQREIDAARAEILRSGRRGYGDYSIIRAVNRV